jgi:streptogramin lyase
VPLGVAAGPDGHVWFTEALGDNIGRMSTGAVWNVDMTAGNNQSATVSSAFANALHATATGARHDLAPMTLLGIGLVMIGAMALGASRRRKFRTARR